jgi:hypothetical protein
MKIKKKKKKTVEASFSHFWLEEPNREFRDFSKKKNN